jgi:hypothetical protein
MVKAHGRFEGTGIGLASMREADEPLDGTVGLESDGEKGSTFWIELYGRLEDIGVLSGSGRGRLLDPSPRSASIWE